MKRYLDTHNMHEKMWLEPFHMNRQGKENHNFIDASGAAFITHKNKSHKYKITNEKLQNVLHHSTLRRFRFLHIYFLKITLFMY